MSDPGGLESAKPASERRSRLVLILAGLMISAAFVGIARFHGEGGRPAPPLHDALLFHQYGRAWAEGRPYRFSPGAERTTGSTSHLYPALLGLLHAAGARGDALTTAAFLLNIVGFLIFLVAMRALAQALHPPAANLATGLVVLSGHAAIGALSLTDMGLFMAVSAAALAAAATARWGWLTGLLVLAPWVRPEGGLLALALAAAAIAPVGPQGRIERVKLVAAGLAGLLSLAGTLALNYALTGSPIYHSMMGKGLHVSYPLAGWLRLTAEGVVDLIREGVFGIGTNVRRFFVLPVLGGTLAIVGLASRRWSTAPTAPAELGGLISALLVAPMIALSGWSGAQHDRYLAWLLPLGLVYVAIGAAWVAERLGSPKRLALVSAPLLAFQGLTLLFFAALYADGCAWVAANAGFARLADRLLPDGSRVGFVGGAGLSYYLPGKTIVGLNGIVSPPLSTGDCVPCALETLKHRPARRFEAWMLLAPQIEGQWFSSLIGGPIAVETPALGAHNAFTLHQARWDKIDGAEEPLSPNAFAAIGGLRLIDRLDVGHTEDERRCAYRTVSRLAGARLQPVVQLGRAGARDILEVGRLVLGEERFTVAARPGLPLRVVLRTGLLAVPTVYLPGDGLSPQGVEFVSPITVHVTASSRGEGASAGRAFVAPFRFELPPAQEGFAEVVFDIPAEWIDGEAVELVVAGDHVAFAYWFYQADSARENGS